MGTQRAVADSTDPVNPTAGNDVGCFPTGVPRIWVHPFPTEIRADSRPSGRTSYEFNHFVREIYTNGGHEHRQGSGSHRGWANSVGWWEGDTLVIDSVGFNDKTWLDRAGLPHSDQLHVIERITRSEARHAARGPYYRSTTRKRIRGTWARLSSESTNWSPTGQLAEMICEDNVTFNDLKKAGKEQ